jgi:hypothetical protein
MRMRSGVFGNLFDVTKEISFEVDIFDKRDIKAKLPELQTMIEQKRRELADLENRYRQLRTWAGLPTKTRSKESASIVAGTTVGGGGSISPSNAIEEVVEIVERIGRPMRSREVVIEMGSDAKRDTASWALWAAEGAGRLKRISKGLYAPLDYAPSDNGNEVQE